MISLIIYQLASGNLYIRALVWTEYYPFIRSSICPVKLNVRGDPMSLSGSPSHTS
jgi:hypothetical protein